MGAETLRRTAALIRERAEAALSVGPDTCGFWYTAEALHDPDGRIPDLEDAEHIASWHPVVALAVADWVDATAREFDALNLDFDTLANSELRGRRTAALAVARAYLGDDN